MRSFWSRWTSASAVGPSAAEMPLLEGQHGDVLVGKT